jgi:hypothetical protein
MCVSGSRGFDRTTMLGKCVQAQGELGEQYMVGEGGDTTVGCKWPIKPALQ